MSKRKTSTPCDVKKPLRKMRALSGYNLWHGEYLQSHGNNYMHNQKSNLHQRYTLYKIICHTVILLVKTFHNMENNANFLCTQKFINLHCTYNI